MQLKCNVRLIKNIILKITKLIGFGNKWGKEAYIVNILSMYKFSNQKTFYFVRIPQIFTLIYGSTCASIRFVKTADSMTDLWWYFLCLYRKREGKSSRCRFGGIKIRHKNSIEPRTGRESLSDSLFICAATTLQRLHNAPCPMPRAHTRTHERVNFSNEKEIRTKKEGKANKPKAAISQTSAVWSPPRPRPKKPNQAHGVYILVRIVRVRSNNFKLPPPI